MGKRWNEKQFEVKEGVIRYVSHGEKLKKNFDLYQCSVSICGGEDFSVQPLPQGAFPFILRGSQNAVEPWTMELCASTAADRDEWVLLLKKFESA